MNITGYFFIKSKESINQSNTFTRCHKRYDVTIGIMNSKKSISFEYQCNPRYSKPNLNDCLYAIVSDAQSYEYCNDDIQFFADEFGYTNIKECINAFNGCKRAYNDIINAFGENMYRVLQKHFEDY